MIYNIISDLIEEINLNAARGFYGPGTYRCRHPVFTVTGPCMTQSPLVRWGQGANQQMHLRKRFTCAATNVVYGMYCQACHNDGLWTTYVGESNMVTSHHKQPNLSEYFTIFNISPLTSTNFTLF